MNAILKNVKVINIFVFLLFLNNIYYSYTGEPCEEINNILENKNIRDIKNFSEIYYYILDKDKFLDIINNTNTNCMLHKETKESNFIMRI